MPRYESATQAFARTNGMPAGPQAIRTLTDVKAPSPTNNQVLTWNSTDQKWEPTSPVAGIATFPITYTDGTYTYQITIPSAGKLELRVYANASPTGNFSYLLLNQSDMTIETVRDVQFINGRHVSIAPGGNVSIIPAGTVSIAPTGTVSIKSVIIDPSGGSSGDVLTSNGAGTLALAAPGATSSHDYEPSFLLGGM